MDNQNWSESPQAAAKFGLEKVKSPRNKIFLTVILLFLGGSLFAFVSNPLGQDTGKKDPVQSDSTPGIFFYPEKESLTNRLYAEILDTAMAKLELSSTVRPKPIRVEVLNGCGKQGIAKKVTDFLREYGFDVVNIDNAESFNFEETIVIDRIGEKVCAKFVGKAINSRNIIQQQDPTRLLEVSVIIGHDYETLFSNLLEKK